MKFNFKFSIALMLVIFYYPQDKTKKIRKWNTLKIPVCWESSAKNDPTEKDWVKNAITNTWQKESALEFINWCPCSENMPGIHIAVADDKEGPRVIFIGADLDGINDGLFLNFTFTNWGSGLTTQLKTRKTAIEAVAVHEFGHALGFTHQQNRKNCYLCNVAPENQKEYLEEIKSNTDKEGLWSSDCDQFSVMNYCNNEYANGGKLSDGDVEAIRFLYGNPHLPDIKDKIQLEYTADPTNKTSTQSGSRQSQDQQERKEYVVKKYRYYRIIMKLAASPEIINNVQRVEYFVDPSIPLNKMNVKDPSENFKVDFNAWGNFKVKAIIYFKNLSPPMTVYKPLTKIPPFEVAVRKAGTKITLFKKQSTKTGAQQRRR